VLLADRRAYYIVLLDHARDVAIARVGALSVENQSTSALPSGWTPLSLLKHLTFVEMRWLEWGFDGVSVDHPFADRVEGRFTAEPSETYDVVVTALTARGATTRRIIAAHDLDDVGAPSNRWDGDPPPTLERVLQHLVFEYARHLGHLDIVVETATGLAEL
jgi:hypothetical protein